MTFKHLL